MITHRTITVTPQQIEAARHQAAIREHISRRFFGGIDLAEIERQAFEKHPPQSKPVPLHGFQTTEPVPPELTKLQVDIAKQNLPKREPKRSRKSLP